MKVKNKKAAVSVTDEKQVEEEFEYRPERMKRLPRGSFQQRHPDFDPARAEKKVKITMYVDSDVLEHFKGRAAQPNAAPYQTQMNSALRAAMDGETQGAGGEYAMLLNDERFIKALAERVRAVE